MKKIFLKLSMLLFVLSMGTNAAWADMQGMLEELQKSIENSRTEEDYMRYQLNELQTAALREDEQEELEQEQETASHTEEIKTALYEVTTLLSGEDGAAVEQVRQAEGKLGSAAAIYPKVTELSERLDSLYVELKDIATDIEAESERIEFNPERLAYVTERLNTIYSLEHKYHTDDIAGLLREQERLQTLLNGIDNSDEVLKEKRETVRQLTDIANKKADKLTATRKQAAKKIEAETKRSLEALGMPGVEFCIDIKASALSPEGQDKVAYLFSANKGMALRPVAEVASGGEIARLMLSLKAMISGAVKLPTIIFDEIDTGVSGRIAEQMGNIMHRMGEAERQVISITHLPQIAARGTYHYKVEKKNLSDSTSTMMRQLTKEERIDEIAQMLSGADITDAARRNAKMLLGN